MWIISCPYAFACMLQVIFAGPLFYDGDVLGNFTPRRMLSIPFQSCQNQFNCLFPGWFSYSSKIPNHLTGVRLVQAAPLVSFGVCFFVSPLFVVQQPYPLLLLLCAVPFPTTMVPFTREFHDNPLIGLVLSTRSFIIPAFSSWFKFQHIRLTRSVMLLCIPPSIWKAGKRFIREADRRREIKQSSLVSPWWRTWFALLWLSCLVLPGEARKIHSTFKSVKYRAHNLLNNVRKCPTFASRGFKIYVKFPQFLCQHILLSPEVNILLFKPVT